MVILLYHFTIDLEIYDPIKNDTTNFEQYLEDTNKIIDYIFDRLNNNKIKITCFVTNEFVEHFYEKFTKKIYPYHEISCHTVAHIFYKNNSGENFFNSIKENKLYLEEVIGKTCNGFRSPSGLVPKRLVKYLINLGFRYDSSVVPGIIPGRSNHFFSPIYPYYPDKFNIYREGINQKLLLEFPLSVFPFIRISANGFLYPYLFIPFTKYYLKKNTTTYVHLHNFFEVKGKKFMWDYLLPHKINLNYFNKFVSQYRNYDLSLINQLNKLNL
jgi:hypothetical protein